MNFDPRKQKAYTLTELAVVLGIIGLIIGAIWVAYASMINTMNTNELIKEIRYILTTLNNIYTGDRSALALADPSSVSCTPATTCGSSDPPTCTPQPQRSYSNSDQTLNAVQLGVFPTNMIQPGITYPISPWSQVKLSVQTISNACSVSPATAASYNVILNFMSMPSIACSRLLLSTGRELASRGLFQIGIGSATQSYIYNVTITTSTVSSVLSSANVATWCTLGNTASNVQLSMQFNWPPTTF